MIRAAIGDLSRVVKFQVRSVFDSHEGSLLSARLYSPGSGQHVLTDVGTPLVVEALGFLWLPLQGL